MDNSIKTVEGIAYWANITVPSTTYEPTYQVEVVVDDAVADDLEARGFPTINGTAKRQDGGPKTSDHYEGRAVMIKRRVSRKDGTPNIKPKLQVLDLVEYNNGTVDEFEMLDADADDIEF